VALLLVSRPDAAPTAGGPLPFSKVAGLPLVMATAPNGGRLLMEEEARRQGLQLNIAAEVNSGHLTKRLVENGPLYTVSNGPSIDDEVRAGRLRAVPICQPELRQTFHLALGGRRQPSAAVRCIADLVRSLVGVVAERGFPAPGCGLRLAEP
jgi:DNA-binding transcriptional LysR family regulator